MAYRLEKCILALVTAAGLSALTYTEGFAQEAPKPTPKPAPEMRCGPTQSIDAFLRSKGYAEASFGIINPQAAMLIYATPGGGTWVAVLIGTDGQACFSFEGVEWWPGAVPEAPVEGERAA